VEVGRNFVRLEKEFRILVRRGVADSAAPERDFGSPGIMFPDILSGVG
jgi:hypothetical protein